MFTKIQFNNFMIKLQVEHSKHPQGSGAKLQIKKSKDKKGKSPEPEVKIVEQQQPEKQAKKDKKDKKQKQDKKDKKEKKDKPDKKKKEEEEKEAKGDKKKQKKEKKKGEQQQKQKADKTKGKKDKKDKKEKEEKKKDKDKKGSKSKDKMSSSLLKQDAEESTIKNINKSQERAKMTLQELIQQYKDTAQRILFNNHGSDPDKQRQIQKQLNRLQKQKQNRHQKLEELQKHKEQIMESRIKQKEVNRELRKQKLREKKIEKIQEKLRNLQENAEQRKEDYKKFLEYAKERKKVIPRYKRYEQQFKQKEKEFQENSNQVLDQLKKVHQPMNLQEIYNFSEHYMNQLQEGEHYRQNKLRLQEDMLKEENKRMVKGLWHGKCHRNVKQQLEQRQHRKHQNSEKQQNRKEFGKYIKEKLMKDIQNKEEENQNKDGNEQEVEEDKEGIRVREKYIQGINYGLIKEQKTKPLTLEQHEKLGKVYLDHIRELNKHRKNKTVDYNNSGAGSKLMDSQQLKAKSKTYKLRRKINPYYSSEARKGSLDFNNYQSIEFSLEKISAIEKEKKLFDQIIKHGDFHGILDIQEKKRRAGNLVVKQINEKLNVLEKI